MEIEVIAAKRELQGTGASRRLRHAGKVPGIVYGGTAAPVQIELEHNTLYHALRKESFHASVLTLNIDGARVLWRRVSTGIRCSTAAPSSP